MNKREFDQLWPGTDYIESGFEAHEVSHNDNVLVKNVTFCIFTTFIYFSSPADVFRILLGCDLNRYLMFYRLWIFIKLYFKPSSAIFNNINQYLKIKALI